MISSKRNENNRKITVPDELHIGALSNLNAKKLSILQEQHETGEQRKNTVDMTMCPNKM
jgi:hypothetical protein